VKLDNDKNYVFKILLLDIVSVTISFIKNYPNNRSLRSDNIAKSLNIQQYNKDKSYKYPALFSNSRNYPCITKGYPKIPVYRRFKFSPPVVIFHHDKIDKKIHCRQISFTTF